MALFPGETLAKGGSLLRLKPGDRAGDLDTLDMEGRRITLKDSAGSKFLLSFHRYASCPLA
jgi:peroxiredoxin